MFKKFSVLMVIIMIASMILAACGGGEATEADCPKPEVLCVGLVTDVGEVDDKSLNQSAWEGVQQAGTELGALAKFVGVARDITRITAPTSSCLQCPVMM